MIYREKAVIIWCIIFIAITWRFSNSRRANSIANARHSTETLRPGIMSSNMNRLKLIFIRYHIHFGDAYLPQNAKNTAYLMVGRHYFRYYIIILMRGLRFLAPSCWGLSTRLWWYLKPHFSARSSTCRNAPHAFDWWRIEDSVISTGCAKASVISYYWFSRLSWLDQHTKCSKFPPHLTPRKHAKTHECHAIIPLAQCINRF